MRTLRMSSVEMIHFNSDTQIHLYYGYKVISIISLAEICSPFLANFCCAEVNLCRRQAGRRLRFVTADKCSKA